MHYDQKVPVCTHKQPVHDTNGKVTQPGDGKHGKLSRQGSKTHVENASSWSNFYAAGQNVKLKPISKKEARLVQPACAGSCGCAHPAPNAGHP